MNPLPKRERIFDVLQNPDTDPTILRHFATEGYSVFRSQVGAHPKTPVNILDVLSRDRIHWVRSTVARNPSTRIETIVEMLNTETDEDIVQALLDRINRDGVVGLLGSD